MSGVKKELGEASYQQVLDILDARRKAREQLFGPVWAQTILDKVPESIPIAALALYSSFLVAAAAGASGRTLGISLGLGILLLFSGYLLLSVALASCSFAWLRAKRPRRTSARSVVEDCVWMERLAVCLPRAVKSVHRIRAAERERMRDGQLLILGDVRKISPFAIMVVLLFVSQLDVVLMVKQFAPALSPLISRPLNAAAAILIANVIAYARLWAYAKDASLSTDLMLLSGALEYIESGQKPSGGADSPAPAALNEGIPTSEDEGAASEFAMPPRPSTP